VEEAPEEQLRSAQSAEDDRAVYKASPEAMAWGREQARLAPPWSDAKFRRVCGMLGMHIQVGEEGQKE